jgi:hypothetical protein
MASTPPTPPLFSYICVNIYFMIPLVSNSSPVSLYLPNPSYMLSLASNPVVFPYISVNLYSMLSLASNPSPLPLYQRQLVLHDLSGLQPFPSFPISASICTPCPLRPPTCPFFPISASTCTPCSLWPPTLPLSPLLGVKLYSMLSLASNPLPLSLFIGVKLYSMTLSGLQLFPSLRLLVSNFTPCSLWPPTLLLSPFVCINIYSMLSSLQPFPSLSLHYLRQPFTQCSPLGFSGLQSFPSLPLYASTFSPCSLWPPTLPLFPYRSVNLYSMLSLASNSSTLSPFICINIYSMLSLWPPTLPLSPFICFNIYSRLSLASNPSPLSLCLHQHLIHAFSGLQPFPFLPLIDQDLLLLSLASYLSPFSP